MGVEMVLNELSLAVPARDKYIARQWMETFLQTIREAASSKVDRILRTVEGIESSELAPQYTLAQWRNDPGVDEVARRYFRSLSVKVPPIPREERDVADRALLYELRFRGGQAQGLEAAWLRDALAVSLLGLEHPLGQAGC